MQAAAHVQAAIELLAMMAHNRTPADRLVSSYFRQRRYIGSKDKLAITTHFYTVIRQKLALEYLLIKAELEVTPAHLLAAKLQISGQDIARVFTGQKHQPERLKSLSSFAELKYDWLQYAPWHVRLNLPLWLEPKLQDSLGEYFEAEMLSTQQRAPLHLRVNTLKANRDEVLAAFTADQIECEAGALSPWAIKINQRLALNNRAEFKHGLVEVQDEGSQILAMLASAKPGETTVDFCAGAGGKALAMAATMENKGSLYACDVHDKRLRNLAARAKRSGVHNIRSVVLSSEQDKWVKKHSKRADLVLVDAPCSGTGTWRRNPDLRWNLEQEDLENLVELQGSILHNASRLVRPGGRLLYATCSLLKEENENQALRFLDSNPEFSELPMQLPEKVVSSSKAQLRLMTSKHETDGFYAAGFVRNS